MLIKHMTISVMEHQEDFIWPRHIDFFRSGVDQINGWASGGNMSTARLLNLTWNNQFLSVSCVSG